MIAIAHLRTTDLTSLFASTHSSMFTSRIFQKLTLFQFFKASSLLSLFLPSQVHFYLYPLTLHILFLLCLLVYETIFLSLTTGTLSMYISCRMQVYTQSTMYTPSLTYTQCMYTVTHTILLSHALNYIDANTRSFLALVSCKFKVPENQNANTFKHLFHNHLIKSSVVRTSSSLYDH